MPNLIEGDEEGLDVNLYYSYLDELGDKGQQLLYSNQVDYSAHYKVVSKHYVFMCLYVYVCVCVYIKEEEGEEGGGGEECV